MLIDFPKNHKLYFKQMDIDKRIPTCYDSNNI